MDNAINAEARRKELRAQLHPQQLQQLQTIEQKLCEKLALPPVKLFGDRKTSNFLLQEAFIYLVRTLIKPEIQVPWLAGYLGVRPFQIVDFEEAVREQLKRLEKAPTQRSQFLAAIIDLCEELTTTRQKVA